MQTGKGILIPSILKVGNGTLKKSDSILRRESGTGRNLFRKRTDRPVRHGCHGFTETGRNHGIGVQRVGHGRYR